MKVSSHLSRAMLVAFLAIGTIFAEPREVRIASPASTLSPMHAQSQLFVAEIEKRLPGQFDFKLFPSGQLGKQKDLLINVQAGSLEMVIAISAVLHLDNKLGIFDLPWLFVDYDHVRRTMAAGLEEDIRTLVERVGKLKVIGVYANGFRDIVNSKRPVVEPFDMEGLKIRTSGGKFRQNLFLKMGALPQTIAWGETFTALQSGVVDGSEAATYGFYEAKQYEVAKYLSLTRHVYTPSFLLASNAFMQSLNQEQRQVFIEVGRSITDQAYEVTESLEKKYLDEMEDLAKVNEVDLAAFQKVTASSYDDYIKSYGDEYIKLIRENASQ